MIASASFAPSRISSSERLPPIFILKFFPFRSSIPSDEYLLQIDHKTPIFSKTPLSSNFSLQAECVSEVLAARQESQHVHASLITDGKEPKLNAILSGAKDIGPSVHYPDPLLYNGCKYPRRSEESH
jgi:hypothetical protein